MSSYLKPMKGVADYCVARMGVSMKTVAVHWMDFLPINFAVVRYGPGHPQARQFQSLRQAKTPQRFPQCRLHSPAHSLFDGDHKPALLPLPAIDRRSPCKADSASYCNLR